MALYFHFQQDYTKKTHENVHSVNKSFRKYYIQKIYIQFLKTNNALLKNGKETYTKV